MPVDDVITKSEESLATLNKDRRWEIHTRFGVDHRPEDDLAEAVAAHRQRFGIPETEDLKGTAVAWNNGVESGKSVTLSVALASLAELKAKAAKPTSAAVPLEAHAETK